MTSAMLVQAQDNSSINLAHHDEERELVARFCKTVTGAGIAPDPLDVVNFYVAIKSKPLIILTGPAGSGKIVLVERLSNILNAGYSIEGGDRRRFQVMLGHPWWVGSSENMAFFTDAHMRFTTDKLLFMLNEAWQPENSSRLYLACLTRISPAELMDFFSELALQIRRGEISRFGDLDLETPLPFPPNFRLVGTMDTFQYNLWEEDLLSQAVVVPWTGAGPTDGVYIERSQPPGEFILLRSSVRSRQGVYRKIHSILEHQRQPLLPLVRIENLLVGHGIPFPRSVFENALTYLANSWSSQGNGLFAPSTRQNLTIALDMVISQIVLLPLHEVIGRAAGLQSRLIEILATLYPRSARFVRSIAVGSVN